METGTSSNNKLGSKAAKHREVQASPQPEPAAGFLHASVATLKARADEPCIRKTRSDTVFRPRGHRKCLNGGPL